MKPQISRSDVEEILRHYGVTESVALVGIRGYYLDTFGKKGANDRGVYDDAIILISRRKFETFQANTDPSIFRPGIASMLPGVHYYVKGKHKGRYWALRLENERVPVTRDGRTGESVGIALNIHKGGIRNTGSEGCQTIQPKDWDDFIELVYDEMDFYKQKHIPYLLVEEARLRRPDTSTTSPVARMEAAATPADERVNTATQPSQVPSQPMTVSTGIGQITDEFKAHIPQIDTAKRWLRRLFTFFTTGAGAAYAAGLPQWVVVTLTLLVAIVVIGGIVLLALYHKQVFAYVTAMNQLRADPSSANPIVTSEDPS